MTYSTFATNASLYGIHTAEAVAVRLGVHLYLIYRWEDRFYANV